MIYYNLPTDHTGNQRRFAEHLNKPIEEVAELGYFIAINLRTHEKFIYTTSHFADELIIKPADEIHGPYDRHEVFNVRLRNGKLPQYAIQIKSSPHKRIDRKDGVQEIDHHNAIRLFDLCDDHKLPRPTNFGFSLPERKARARRRTPMDWALT